MDNAGILENLVRAARDFPHTSLHVRVPLIPGVNDSPDNLRATAAFCSGLNSCETLEFLPYHRLGAAAYESLGRPYAFAGLPPMQWEKARALVASVLPKSLPFEVRIAGTPV